MDFYSPDILLVNQPTLSMQVTNIIISITDLLISDYSQLERLHPD